MRGAKKSLKNEQVKTQFCPQYENLTLHCIGEFAKDYPEISHYLPDAPDIPKTPKQFIVNLCAAVIGQPFKDWVKQQVEARNAIMCEKREMMIAIDPEMAQKFKDSTHISRK